MSVAQLQYEVETKKLELELAKKQTVLNELFQRIQETDVEIRRMVEERSALNETIRGLRDKVSKLEDEKQSLVRFKHDAIDFARSAWFTATAMAMPGVDAKAIYSKLNVVEIIAVRRLLRDVYDLAKTNEDVARITRRVDQEYFTPEETKHRSLADLLRSVNDPLEDGSLG